MIDIKQYKPGRFAYMMGKPFAVDAWAFLTEQDHILAMGNAIAKGRPAIEPLIADIETRFEEHLTSKEYHDDDACVLVNNMILQILELRGFRHVSCGLCAHARFIKQSGIYKKVTD